MQKLDRILAGVNLSLRRKSGIRILPVADAEVIRVIPAIFAGFELRTTTNPEERN